MNIYAEVYKSIQRKKSIEDEALRLGLTVDEYVETKDAITDALRDHKDDIGEFISKLINSAGEPLKITTEGAQTLEVHENIEDGTCKLTSITSDEPRSSEEIIALLKIDTTKWKLSQYWNKQKGSNWVISALVTKLPQENTTIKGFYETLANREITPLPVPDYTEVRSGGSEDNPVCGVISLQDLHFGKVHNDDIGEYVEKALHSLLTKSYNIYDLEELVFTIGGDILNADSFNNTTTKGTFVESSMTPVDAYVYAFDEMCKAIQFLKRYTRKLKVVYIPGNHDRLSSFHLLHALSQYFRLHTDIEFITDFQERRVFTYGVNMLAFEHGDISAKNNPLVFATEYPKEWGETKYRTLYTGHYHSRKTKEFVTENEDNGFVTRIIPALTGSDYYHYHNKYVGSRRSAILHIHDKYNGLVTEFIYNV